jgi:hypothetical protein
LKRAQIFMMLAFGPMWAECFKFRIDELGKPTESDKLWAHVQWHIGYLADLFGEGMNQFLEMLATSHPTAFEPHYDNKHVSFDNPSMAVDIWKVLFRSFRFIPESYVDNEYALRYMAQSGVGRGLAPRDGGADQGGSVPRRSDKRSRSNSMASSKSSTSVQSVISSTSTPRSARGSSSKPTANAKKTVTFRPCYQTFLYTIGAKEADGKKCSPCPAGCTYDHPKIPPGKKERLALAQQYFEHPRRIDTYNRAKKAIG